MNNNPIGIFDSGLGGLSVWKEVLTLLPHESTIYYGDSKNAPYGSKSKEEIIELSTKITDFLISKGCKIIIVACNTATAAAIHFLRSKYSIQFIGMEPAIKPAAEKTITKNIGVLATQATLNGNHFNQTLDKYCQNVNVHSCAANGLVEIVEHNLTNQSETELLLRKYIEPLLSHNIDQLVLGCTHYPFLIKNIESIIPSEINIINPASAVAKQAKRIIENYSLESVTNEVEHKLYTSGKKENMVNIIEQISICEKLNLNISNI